MINMSKYSAGTHDVSVFSFSIHYVIIYLYIIERLSSWGTLRIHPSWPRSETGLDLLPALFHMYLLVCLGPPSILLFLPTIHVSHVHPPLTTWRLNTSTQVNNMTMLCLMYNGHTYIHHKNITIFFFFTLLHFWAGRLALILLVGNR
jgi:hypothetical protein